MVDVLRSLHVGLVAGGALIDLRPTGLRVEIRGAGESLGDAQADEFRRTIVTTDAALDRVVDEGLFERMESIALARVLRFSSPHEMISEVRSWQGIGIDEDLERRILEAAGPFDVTERNLAHQLRRRSGG